MSGAPSISSTFSVVSAAQSSDAAEMEDSTPSSSECRVTMNTDLKSVSDLKEKAPHVYHATLRGIATTICMSMSRRQHRINKMIREGH